MVKMIRKLLEILDGTPAIYGKSRQKGQSLVEMTLITPLLIILIVGIVEVGWYASNYLTLLEVTRVGARRGAILSNENSAKAWNNQYSLMDDREVDPIWFPDGSATPPDLPDGMAIDDYWDSVETERKNARNCGFLESYGGYYNIILCQMLQSMTPLEIDRENGIDDVIISAFSIQMINNNDPAYGGDIKLYPDSTDPNYDPNVPKAQYPEYYKDDGAGGQVRNDTYIPVVVGRFPVNANECTVFEKADKSGYITTQTVERDPFDYYNNGKLDLGYVYDNSKTTISGTPPSAMPSGATKLVGIYPIELAEYIGGTWMSAGYDEGPELQRGFVYTGQHQVPQEDMIDIDGEGVSVFCWGSERDIYWLQEQLMNKRFQLTDEELQEIRLTHPQFGLDEFNNPIDTRQYYTHQGAVLVEIYWQHHLLLDFPVFSPVMQALGDDQTTIYVWSVFPVDGLAPRIDYTKSCADFAANAAEECIG